MNIMRTRPKTRHLVNLSYASGFISLILAIMFSLTGADFQAAPQAAIGPGLGSAASFAVLGASTVTNSGASIVTGDVGVSPGTAITGFPPGLVIGSIHAADAVAGQAQNDVTSAYNNLAGQACNTDLTGQDLGGLTLVQGVYCFSSSAQLTGPLTLDAQGDSDAVWVFQIGSALNSASNSSVQVINGGGNCNVFWQVGSSATLGTGTGFAGNILALTSISLTTGTDVSGRVLAQNGAVTMDTNDISLPPCGVAATPTEVPPTAIPASATPTAPLPTEVPATVIPASATPTAPLPTEVPPTGVPLTPTSTAPLPTEVPPTEVPATPTQPIATPTQAMATPTQAMATPTQAMATPTQMIATPTQALATPTQPIATPTEAMATPTEVLATPTQAMATPTQAMATPTQTLATPTQTLATPTQAMETPTEVLATPTQAMATPTQMMATPTQVPAAPTQVLATPTQALATPTEVLATPTEVLATPTEVLATPTEVVATPIATMTVVETSTPVSTAINTETPVPMATPSSTPALAAGGAAPSILPVTGVDRVEARVLAARQTSIGLGSLGMMLVLLGFTLRRKLQ